MRTQAEWNVITHMDRARGPTSAATRAAISPAALLVKVMARISCGATPRAASRYAIRWVSTRVFPEPAPRSEEHTSELQSRLHLVCRLLLEKQQKKQSTDIVQKKKKKKQNTKKKK